MHPAFEIEIYIYIYFFLNYIYIYCFVQNIFVLVYEKYISSKCICACMSIAKKMQSYHLRQIVSHESIKWKTLFFWTSKRCDIFDRGM